MPAQTTRKAETVNAVVPVWVVPPVLPLKSAIKMVQAHLRRYAYGNYLDDRSGRLAAASLQATLEQLAEANPTAAAFAFVWAMCEELDRWIYLDPRCDDSSGTLQDLNLQANALLQQWLTTTHPTQDWLLPEEAQEYTKVATKLAEDGADDPAVDIKLGTRWGRIALQLLRRLGQPLPKDVAPLETRLRTLLTQERKTAVAPGADRFTIAVAQQRDQLWLGQGVLLWAEYLQQLGQPAQADQLLHQHLAHPDVRLFVAQRALRQGDWHTTRQLAQESLDKHKRTANLRTFPGEAANPIWLTLLAEAADLASDWPALATHARHILTHPMAYRLPEDEMLQAYRWLQSAVAQAPEAGDWPAIRAQLLADLAQNPNLVSVRLSLLLHDQDLPALLALVREPALKPDRLDLLHQIDELFHAQQQAEQLQPLYVATLREMATGSGGNSRLYQYVTSQLRRMVRLDMQPAAEALAQGLIQDYPRRPALKAAMTAFLQAPSPKRGRKSKSAAEPDDA